MKELRRDLKAIKKIITTENLDHISLVTGFEGSGKSSLALIMCKLLDPTFDKSRICFNLNQFKKAVFNSKPGQAVLIDEGQLLLYVRSFMQRDQVEMMKMIQGIRKFNLFVVICIPKITNIEKYIREDRVTSMFRVMKRARAWAYSFKQIQKIHLHRRTKKLVYPYPQYRFSYPACKTMFPKLWKEYEKHKDKVFIEEFAVKEEKVTKSNPFNLTRKKLGDLLGVSEFDVRNKTKFMKEEKHFIFVMCGSRREKRYCLKATEFWKDRVKFMNLAES